jgi:hypothetical protein
MSPKRSLHVYYDSSGQGILKGKYHCTTDLLFDWFGLVCFANKNKKNVGCHTADSKPIKQEVNGTVILPLLVFPAQAEPQSSTDAAKCDRILHRIGHTLSCNKGQPMACTIKMLQS